MVNTVVSTASLKGPALVEHDEGTSTGETLIFVLLLHYFAVKRVCGLAKLLVSLKPSEPLAFIGIRCHDLCRLLHFGSPVIKIKIAASYSLLELFNRISDQINSNHEELRCTVGYLMSIRSILEGLVLYNDLATNFCFCLSIILGWENLTKETKLLEGSSWCRLTIEEMTISFCSSCFSITIIHEQTKPSSTHSYSFAKTA
ncbi:hypothetical protein ACSQ67_011716 [Phaseolus vulgaris]